MPSVALLRKRILSVLQDKILPDLSGKKVRRLVVARVPLEVPADIAVRPMAHAPLQEEDAKQVYPEGKRWAAVGMHSMRFPVLVCIVDGEADILMGVTAAMLNRAGLAVNGTAKSAGAGSKNEVEGASSGNVAAPPGGYILSMPALSYFVLPPDAPVAGGDVLPWVRNEPHVGRTNYLYLQTLPVGALCQMMSMVNGVFAVEYSLLVQDPQLAACMDILVDELTHDPYDARIAHAQMLTLMLRLQRRLKARMPLLTDGLYSRFPEGDRLSGEARVRDNPVVEKVLQFIQLYLHEPLTPERIAAHVRMTPNQLNRVLRRNTGLTIMGSLQRLRMEAAQLLLHTSSLSVLEISRLVGFSQQPHFSRTFHSYTGTSPLKFRQQHEVESHSH